MDKVVDYLINERHNTPVVARQLYSVLSKYDDIIAEFKIWLESRSYVIDNAVSIEGYTAQKIHNIAPFLDGCGVYSFLVTLRDSPSEALNIVQGGFARK